MTPEFLIERALILSAGLALLAACAAPIERPIEGPAVQPPAGWAAYCARHPEREECR